ncbi:MAG TPA: hypothetical protein VKA49_21040 [Flavitalea sp.]|nr:hypothetical protein [Flavitalea sp.]
MKPILIVTALSICLAGCTKLDPRPQVVEPENAALKEPATQKARSVSSLVIPAAALIPDLQTVIPQHLQVVSEHRHDLLRFSNGIANTGVDALQFKPEFRLGYNTAGTQNAVKG